MTKLSLKVWNTRNLSRQ